MLAVVSPILTVDPEVEWERVSQLNYNIHSTMTAQLWDSHSQCTSLA